MELLCLDHQSGCQGNLQALLQYIYIGYDYVTQLNMFYLQIYRCEKHGTLAAPQGIQYHLILVKCRHVPFTH